MSKFIVGNDDKIEALSYSQMNTFLRCRKQWEYSYIMDLVPRIDKPSLTVGKLAHVGMAAYWMTKANNDNKSTNPVVGEVAITEECNNQSILMEGDDFDVFQELRETSIEVYYRALKDFNPDNWSVVSIGKRPAVEIRFAIPLVRGIPLQGFIDLVAQDQRNGGVWQIDWKFVSSLSDKDDELYNMQSVIYQWALRRMRKPVLGSLTFKHLNSPSTKPKINKNGTISRALIRCTWEDYAQFCIGHGQDPEDYREEMEPKLGSIQWSLETREYRNEEMLKTLWDREVRGTAYEILKQQTRYPRTISPMTCRMCQYRSLCHGEMRGYDTTSIIDLEFKSKGEES